MSKRNNPAVNSGPIESVIAKGVYITRGLKCGSTPAKVKSGRVRLGTAQDRKAAPQLCGAMKIKNVQRQCVAKPEAGLIARNGRRYVKMSNGQIVHAGRVAK